MVFLKRKKYEKNRKYSFFIVMGIFLVFLGIAVLVYNHERHLKNEKINNEQVMKFFEIEKEENIGPEKPSTGEETPKEPEKPEEKEEEKEKEILTENYIAVLEIPKINLKRGIFDKTSPQNNVNKNVYMLKETTLPDENVNSHILLAAHAGNSYISFFRNLKKLEMKDKIYFYYKGMKYIYEVSNRYEIEKTGTAKIRKTNTSDITLITCVSGTNKQVAYFATMVNKTKM